MGITLRERVLVDCSPRRVREWGYWQFPNIARYGEKFLFTFAEAADSYATYGSKHAYYISDSGLKNWQYISDENVINDAYSIMLPNGDRVRKRSENSALTANLKLPECVGEFVVNDRRYYCYPNGELPLDIGGLALWRKRAGETEWVKDAASMNEPYGIRCAFDGCLPAMQARGNQFLLGPDGKPYLLVYNFKMNPDGKPDPHDRVYLMVSNDNCTSFEQVGEIPYTPVLEDDPIGFDPGRRGFLEPNIVFLKNGDILCVIRTHHRKAGPMYLTRSIDGGRTWEKPHVIARNGVYPHMVQLDCGTIVLSYGRPGVDVMASNDNGITWKDHAVIVPVTNPNFAYDSCGYTSLVAVDSHRCLIGFSDFNYDPGDGFPRKALFSQIVEVE